MKTKITAQDLMRSSAVLEKLVVKQHRKHKTYKILGIALTIIVLALIPLMFLVMKMSLVYIENDQSALFVNKGDVLLLRVRTEYERGEIVAFNYDNAVTFGQIVALENEELNILDDGSVLIDGKLLNIKYNIKDKPNNTEEFPVVIEREKCVLLKQSDADNNMQLVNININGISGKVIFRMFHFR